MVKSYDSLRSPVISFQNESIIICNPSGNSTLSSMDNPLNADSIISRLSGNTISLTEDDPILLNPLIILIPSPKIILLRKEYCKVAVCAATVTCFAVPLYVIFERIEITGYVFSSLLCAISNPVNTRSPFDSSVYIAYGVFHKTVMIVFSFIAEEKLNVLPNESIYDTSSLSI